MPTTLKKSTIVHVGRWGEIDYYRRQARQFPLASEKCKVFSNRCCTTGMNNARCTRHDIFRLRTHTYCYWLLGYNSDGNVLQKPQHISLPGNEQVNSPACLNVNTSQRDRPTASCVYDLCIFCTGTCYVQVRSLCKAWTSMRAFDNRIYLV